VIPAFLLKVLLGSPRYLPLDFLRGTFGLFLAPGVPSSLAEGRAKTRTPRGTGIFKPRTIGRATGGFLGVGWLQVFQPEDFELVSRQEDGVDGGWGVFCSVGGARSLPAGRLGPSRASSAKGIRRSPQAVCRWPRYVSLKSDHVKRPAPGPNQGQWTSPGFTPVRGLPVEITAEFENWRPGVRDFRRRRGLGLSFAVVGSPHRGHHHEEQGRPCAALRARRCGQRLSPGPPAGPGVVAQVKHWRGRAGAVLPAMVSMAGSNSSGCGASTPMRRWISFNEPRKRISRRPLRNAGTHTPRPSMRSMAYDFPKQQTMVVMGPPHSR